MTTQVDGYRYLHLVRYFDLLLPNAKRNKHNAVK